MSTWTHIRGTIDVDVPGRTQAEIDYILQTILDHLPRVTGSEGDMEVHIVRHNGHNSSCSCDEYEMWTNNLQGRYGKSHNGWLKTQSQYSLVVVGNLRDREFSKTHRDFMKWLCRLSKRVFVDSILIRINEDCGKEIIINENRDSPYHNMFESPSWGQNGDEPAWWEHLMWKRWGNTPLPIEHIVKYYNNEKADKEFFEADS